MTTETYEDRVIRFRKQHSDCSYCICNKNYHIQNKVLECVARKMHCYDFKKIAKKCPLFKPKNFPIDEWAWL